MQQLDQPWWPKRKWRLRDNRLPTCCPKLNHPMSQKLLCPGNNRFWYGEQETFSPMTSQSLKKAGLKAKSKAFVCCRLELLAHRKFSTLLPKWNHALARMLSLLSMLIVCLDLECTASIQIRLLENNVWTTRPDFAAVCFDFFCSRPCQNSFFPNLTILQYIIRLFCVFWLSNSALIMWQTLS